MVTKKITNKSEASPEEIKPKKETGSETSSSIAIKKIVHGQAHISASYNNTLLSITDDNGNMVAWSSAGSLGFKGAKKATPYAATKIVETIMEKIKANWYFKHPAEILQIMHKEMYNIKYIRGSNFSNHRHLKNIGVITT